MPKVLKVPGVPGVPRVPGVPEVVEKVAGYMLQVERVVKKITFVTPKTRMI